MTAQKTSKGLHIGLWVAQSLLAAAFAMVGFMKITAPAAQLVESGMSYINTYGIGLARFIGISELLGGIGLILPAALRIKPVLTPVAAIGIAVIMLLASAYHISNGEPFLPSLVLLLLAVFVAWGRFTKARILPK